MRAFLFAFIAAFVLAGATAFILEGFQSNSDRANSTAGVRLDYTTR